MTFKRAACLLTVFVALLVGIWRPSETTEMFAGLEGRLLDLRFAVRGARDPAGDVVILAIDDKALAKFGEFPLSRSSLSSAISTIAKSNPAIVVLDLLLVGSKAGDLQLSNSLREFQESAVAVSFSEKGEAATSGLMIRLGASTYPAILGRVPAGPSRLIGPAAELVAHAKLGHVNVVRDAGGSLRRIPVAISLGDKLAIPALPVVAARAGLGLGRSDVVLVAGSSLKLGERSVALDRQGNTLVNYFGPAATIPTISIADAGSVNLKNKVVFIGGTAEGYGDRFATPYDRGLPGVEALATLSQNIVSGNTLWRDDTTWMLDVVLAVMAAFISTLAAARKSLALALAMSGLIWLVSALIIQLTFQTNIWLDATSVFIALTLGSLAGLVARQLTLDRRSKNLARFGSPQIMEAIATSSAPSFDGRLQNAAALFVDAAGFTPLSHALGPQGTALFLKEFHAVIERAAAGSKGTIEQYTGDGALIIFGLPEPTNEDAANALGCADRLFTQVALLRQRFPLPADNDLRIRVGIHYGEVMAAIVGGEVHRHVTITGTVVNAASRLEQLGKTEGASLIVSEAVLAAAGVRDRSGLRPLGARLLRGLEQPIEIWAREETSP